MWRIVTPGVPDKKFVYWLTQSNYQNLIGAGVRIFQYAPGFIHAKCVLVDDEAATVGTINFDYRSFYHHFECGVYLYRAQAVEELKRIWKRPSGSARKLRCHGAGISL